MSGFQWRFALGNGPRLFTEREAARIRQGMADGMKFREAVDSLTENREGTPDHCALCRERAAIKEETT